MKVNVIVGLILGLALASCASKPAAEEVHAVPVAPPVAQQESVTTPAPASSTDQSQTVSKKTKKKKGKKKKAKKQTQ